MNQAQELTVGPSRWSQGGTVYFNEYELGGIAIQVFGEEGPEYTATVALAGNDPGENCVWLKGWGANEDVPEALEAAGIVELTGITRRTGFAVAQHAKLTEKALAALAAQKAAQAHES